MDNSQQQHSSQLFTIRMWKEDLEGGQSEWRSQVQHGISGETRYFRDWPTLITFLLEKLADAAGRTPTD